MLIFQKSLTFIFVVFQIYIGGVKTQSLSTSSVHSSIPTTSQSMEFSSTETSTESIASVSTLESSTISSDMITSTVPVGESKTTSVHKSNDLLETFSSIIPTTIKGAATSSGSLTFSTSSYTSSSATSDSSTSPLSSTVPSSDSKTQTSSRLKPSPKPIASKPLLSKSGVPFRTSLIRCPKDYIDEYATDRKHPDTENKGKCRNAEDCQGVGWASNKSMVVNVMCAFSEDFTDSGCCYKDTKGLCSQGVSAIPLEECTTLDDCNLQEEKSTKRWCDPVSRTCCRYDNEHDLFCPDYAIPLMNELECNYSKPDDIYSGTCPQPNGICKHGHCCPAKNNGSMLPGEYYKTQMECTDSTVIPKNLTFGYCDPSSRKVFIMGKHNFHGQENKMLDSYCMSGRDCGRSYAVENVCVRISEKTPRCFINPKNKYHEPSTRSLFWVSTLSYISLGTSVLALLFTILYKIYTIDDSLPGERSVSLSEEQSLPLMVSGHS